MLVMENQKNFGIDKSGGMEMSKAILVIDMPNSCIECPCSDFDKQNVCQILVRPIDDETEGLDSKPDWCPLKEVPEKHEELSIEEYEFGKLGLAFTQGWNACLKKILGE